MYYLNLFLWFLGICAAIAIILTVVGELIFAIKDTITRFLSLRRRKKNETDKEH